MKPISGSVLPAICFLLLLVLALPQKSVAHYYNLSECPEEIKDRIIIQLIPGLFIIEYQSEYLGQIVPHIKKMIDVDEDSVLQSHEINSFISDYKEKLNQNLSAIHVNMDSSRIFFKLVDMNMPAIQQDSLLSPLLQIRMRLQAGIDTVAPGNHEINIDPKLFFANGSLLIDKAKKRVQFTDKQEKAIGRVLQIKMYTSQPFQFESAFPGYVKGNKDMVTISGIFYDKTLLKIEKEKYPDMRIGFSAK